MEDEQREEEEKHGVVGEQSRKKGEFDDANVLRGSSENGYVNFLCVLRAIWRITPQKPVLREKYARVRATEGCY